MRDFSPVRDKKRFSKLLALAAALVLTMAVSLAMPMTIVEQAQAHKDPSNANTNAVGGSISVALQSDPGNPLPLGQVLIDGQLVQYNATLNELPDFGAFVFAAFDGGTLNITTPDGVLHNVNPPPDIPCIGGTTDTGDTVGPADCGDALSSFISDAAPYTIDCTDVTGSSLFAEAEYEGSSHSNTGDSLVATASIQIENPCASTILDKDANVTAGLLTDTNTSVAVKYDYTEENDGTDPLDNVSIDDDTCSPVTPVEAGGFNVGDTDTNNILDPGEIWEFECETTFNTPGTFTNTAIGSANTTDDQIVTNPTDEDEEDQFTIDIFAASTNLTKSANTTSINIGDAVKFTFFEGNDGTVDLDNVSVSDDQCTVTAVEAGGFNVGDTNTDGLLNPGEIWEFECEFTFNSVGSFTNNATATGTVTGTGFAEVDGTVIDETNDPDEKASATVEVSGVPSTILTKEGNVTAGLLTDTTTEVAVHYQFNETNDGDLALDNVGVSDDTCSPVTAVEAGGFNVGDTNTNNILDPGEKWEFECETTFNTPGTFTNTANATGTVTGTGTDLDGFVVNATNDEDEEAQFTVEIFFASTNLTKSANVTSGSAPLAVHYSFFEGNDGTVDLDNVSVSDDQCTVTAVEAGGFNVGDTNTDGLLNPGEIWEFECEFTFNTAGSFTNNATATGTVTGTGFAEVDGTVIDETNDPDEKASLTVEVGGGEGCTPGFWKTNAEFHEAVAWPPGIDPTDTVESIFSGIDDADNFDSADLADDSLLDALGYQGGKGLTGAAKILLRAGVAAYLNAADAEVNYPLTPSEVQDLVNDALNTNSRSAMLAVAADLDANNNLGCFQNQQGERIEDTIDG